MSESVFVRCSVDADKGMIVTTCLRMEERMSEANARRAGIVPLVVHNSRTDEEKLYAILHKIDRSDVGMVLNWCPFCGADIAKHIHDLEDKRAIERASKDSP